MLLDIITNNILELYYTRKILKILSMQTNNKKSTRKNSSKKITLTINNSKINTSTQNKINEIRKKNIEKTIESKFSKENIEKVVASSE